MNIQYYKNALILNKNPINAFVCISTFWTQKEKVHALISPENMSEKVLIIGQLYTYEGLQYVCRNLFTTPQAQILILTGFDNNKLTPRIKAKENIDGIDKQHLKQWWEYWTDSENINLVFKDIEIFGNIIFLKDYTKINNLLDMLESRKNWINSPVVLPPPTKAKMQTYDSEKSGFVMRDKSLYNLWIKDLNLIKNFGCNVDGTREIMNLVSVLEDVPIIHKDFPAATQIEQYLPQVCDEKPTGDLSYTYGSRLHSENQINNIINSLSEGIFNRNGVTVTWKPKEDYSHPPPCLILVTFRVEPISENTKITTNQEFKEYMKNELDNLPLKLEDYRPKNQENSLNTSSTISQEKNILSENSLKNKTDKLFTHILYTNTTFRSHDILKALPLNLYGLWYLGQKVINKVSSQTGLKIKHGALTNNSISAHIYEQDFHLLERLTSNEYKKLDEDPRGYFIISLNREENKIKISLMNSKNKELNFWEDSNVRTLCNKVQMYISDVSHALYIGRELERAKYCLENNSEFIQD